MKRSQFRLGALIYWLLPSLYYIADSIGLLGHTGSGFSLTIDLLEASWPYSISAAPLGLLSAYPPTWAWLAAGLLAFSRQHELFSRKANGWMLVLASGAYAATCVHWIMATFPEPYAWTRLALSVVTWPLVLFLLGNSSGVYNFGKTK